MRAGWNLGIFAIASVTVGCTRNDCDPTQTGDLSIELVADGVLPALETPVTVELRREDGSLVEEVTESTVLPALDGGNYRLTVVRGFTAAVDGLRLGFGALENPVFEQCVGGNPATTTIAVAQQPGSGKLWATSWEHVLAYPADPGAGSSAPVADLTIELSNALSAVASDRSGSLWAATGWTYGARLVGIAPGAVSGTGAVAPALEIRATGFLAENALFTGMRFDAEGNAWAVTGPQMGGFIGIVGWSRETMEQAWLTGGVVEAMPDFVGTAPNVEGFSDLWIDAQGDLWTTAPVEAEILHFSADALRVGTPDAPAEVAPAARYRLTDEALVAWSGLDTLAPDGAGGFYTMAWDSGTLVRVTAEALGNATDGRVLATPALPLEVTALPEALTADAAGGVWWLDTGKLGHLAADGSAASVSAAALERPGVAHLDIGR